MLVAAVVGTPGEGKSSLLMRLAVDEIAEGRHVDGFFAVAVGARESGKGAERYAIRFVGSRELVPIAVRDASLQPPYRFDPAGFESVRQWCDSISTEPAPDLVIVDELGPLEAAGEGHYPVWESLLNLRPKALVASVRESEVNLLEGRMGRSFDVVVAAREQDAFERLNDAVSSSREWSRIGAFGAGSGGIEASLGAWLHTAHVPFAGFGLAAIQCGVLSCAAQGLARPERVAWVSTISSGLKALSPSGSRVRPMIAIAMQGALYALALRVLGLNFAGATVGGALAGAWAAVQGIAMQWLFVGSDLMRSYAWLQDWFRGVGLGLPPLELALATLALFSAGLSACASAWVYKRGDRWRRAIEERLAARTSIHRSPSRGAPWRGAIRDLLRPSFWIPLLLVALLASAHRGAWETSVFTILRGIAVGFVLFAAIHAVDVARMAGFLRKRGHWGPASAIESAMASEDP